MMWGKIMQNILPDYVYNSLNNINLELLNEVRLRKGKVVVVCVNGRNYYLGAHGITIDISKGIICDISLIKYVVSKISNDSFYTINEQIIKGYITYKNGIRVGVCGEFVYENGLIRTIKNINSLNIRIPHQIKNCSLNYFNYIVDSNRLYSTLIISSPGAGKTTFVRDIVYQLSKRTNYNIFVLDERGEITGNNSLELGGADVMLNCSKLYGFECSIRNMNPDVIVTDEINFDTDIEAIKQALTCGVKIIATIHAQNIDELKQKKMFFDLIKSKMFERYIVLNSALGLGTVESIYNENLDCIYY